MLFSYTRLNDLNVPFLGVHVTPCEDGTIIFGPTAIPAFGRENYENFSNLEPMMAFDFISNIAKQYFQNKNGFRKYAEEQAMLGLKPLFLKKAQQIVPKLTDADLIPSKKVGIRAQLFDKITEKLVQDFVLDNFLNTTHVLNAISPAFTASFALADLIIKKSNL